MPITSARAGLSPAEVARALGLPVPTPEQAAVIAAPAEPALVVAGAGSGKTETMAARVVWLVANGLVGADQVLGLTFTRKAARALADRVRSRLRRLVGSGLLDEERRAEVMAAEPTVLTYHAYAGRLVSEQGLRLPVEPGARLLTETGAWQLAHRVVSTWEQDLDIERMPTTVTGYLLGLTGELAEHLVDAGRVREHAERLSELIRSATPGKRQRAAIPQRLQAVLDAQAARMALLPLVEAYAERKRREGVLDFADQMALAARLAAGHPEVGELERARYRAVLLDEYQDTGHAQRVLLRALFGRDAGKTGGGTAGATLPVTAVGDPSQSIYGWRGASAANLPRFTTDFPAGDRPTHTYSLLTSFRSPARVLAVANEVSRQIRSGPVAVDELTTRAGANAGDVRVALLPDVQAELAWVADAIAMAWTAADESPTAAVLVRRRADMGPIAAALRERGIPVEVVGLGGLLDTPEVRDLVSMLRLLADPLAGTAAVRLLTGARWRLGAADLAALWRRAGDLAVHDQPGSADAADAVDPVVAALPGEHSEQAGLVDAIDEPGDEGNYSAEGFRRITAFAGELAALRRRLGSPLPELVADVERVLHLDVEVTARAGGVGRAHLDAFVDVVADFAADSPGATLPSLLDYLATAEQAEDGLEPGEVDVATDRVQVLTVHAAKGLEWQVVAMPNMVDKVFPAAKKSSSWLRSVVELPAELRGDAADLPVLRLEGCVDRREVEQALDAHEAEFDERRVVEERRLLYVALTRAEQTLLVSGHRWGETGDHPREPSPFLIEVRDAIAGTAGAGGAAGIGGTGSGRVEHWAEPPAEGSANPLASRVRTAVWPVDPLGERRAAIEHGAELVRAALARPDPRPVVATAPEAGELALFGMEALADDDPDGWTHDVDLLLAERAAAAQRTERVELPGHLSVSQLVELAADPAALASRLRRPVPLPPNPLARRGTAFHAWLEGRFGASRLLDLDELPGAADETAIPDAELEPLQQAFLASEWADRQPHDVEVPFEAELDGVLVRGRMDAVFADDDGGWTIVDWKTGAVPGDERLPAVSVQLAAYRLAWAALAEVPLASVRAAFHYVRQDVTLHPADLLDAQALRNLISTIPAA
jgi:DNA helicase-2/ATP-dependent DNA helicase PcrA